MAIFFNLPKFVRKEMELNRTLLTRAKISLFHPKTLFSENSGLQYLMVKVMLEVDMT